MFAVSRKQIRQIPNLRYTARGRPQNLQRFSCRVLNFGLRTALAIFDLLATGRFPVVGVGTGGRNETGHGAPQAASDFFFG